MKAVPTSTMPARPRSAPPGPSCRRACWAGRGPRSASISAAAACIAAGCATGVGLLARALVHDPALPAILAGRRGFGRRAERDGIARAVVGRPFLPPPPELERFRPPAATGLEDRRRAALGRLRLARWLDDGAPAKGPTHQRTA